MVAKIDIYNDAIALVGGNLITSLTDVSVEAQQCDHFYDKVRRLVLVAHPWNFAIKRVDLSADVTTPVFGYTYEFTLPADCLKVVASEREMSQGVILNPSFNGYLTIQQGSQNTVDDYKVEAGKLLSNQSDVSIKYIYDNETASMFTPAFREILGYRLAMAISYKVSNSTTRASELRADLQAQLPALMATDATEGTFEVRSVSSFLGSRL